MSFEQNNNNWIKDLQRNPDIKNLLLIIHNVPHGVSIEMFLTKIN